MSCFHANNCPFKGNGFTRSWTANCLEAWHYIRNRPATEPVILKVYNVKLSFDIWLVLYMYFILYSWHSTCSLYHMTQLRFTTGWILIDVSSCNLTTLVETTFSMIYRSIYQSTNFLTGCSLNTKSFMLSDMVHTRRWKSTGLAQWCELVE